MEDKRFDLAIAGSGIMGLSCAFEAAKSGKRVVVFDPTEASTKASWAAAGILVTRDAHTFLSPFREFYVRSIHLYPTWLEEISQYLDQNIPLHRGGDYQIYDLSTEIGAEQFKAKSQQLEREHSRNYTLSDQLPPFLIGHSPIKNLKTLHFPGEAYVQNRDLLLGLHSACVKMGIHFVKGETIIPWVHQAGWTDLIFESTQLKAKQVLVAAGAWSGKIMESLGIASPIIPVKGQMIRIPKFYAEDCMLHFHEDLYLVPRGDSLVVGATTEPGVWNEGYDQIGEQYLSKQMSRFLPEVAKTPIESWAGFRPRTRDRLPWMGWINSERGWSICAGHYKCGISMAPLAAQCLTRLMQGEKPLVDLEPFNPWRRQGLSLRTLS
jgi:glycine oxidase